MNQPKPINRLNSAARPRPLPRPEGVTVAISVWATQQVRVVANGGGSPQDQPYIAVTVGDALTYVYDRVALACYVQAWRDAAGHNGALRLPAWSNVGLGARHDLTVLVHTFGYQRVVVVAQQASEGSAAAIRVVVGGVTVQVHTSQALGSYVQAWTQADQLGAVLDPPATVVEPGRD